MSQALRFALLLIAAYPMPTELYERAPRCWLTPSLFAHVGDWDITINPPTSGYERAILSWDYTGAFYALYGDNPPAALDHLEAVIRDPRPELAASGTPEDAAYVADLLHACPSVLFSEGPAPPRPHRLRRLPHAAPRVAPSDEPPALATSR